MSRRFVTSVVLASVSSVALAGVAAAAEGDYRFRVIGQVGIPGWTKIDGVRLGGLSGIDYDAASGTWRVISDDRSDFGPARFYHLTLGVSAKSVDGGLSGGVTSLLRADGTTYPPSATAGADTVEPEAIRFDSRSGNLLWANAGERVLGDSPVLVDTAVRESSTGGQFVRQLAVPGRMKVSTAETGIRARKGMSGLTISPSGSSLVSIAASPLLQDGSVHTRITLQSRSLGGAVTAQYGYPLEAASEVAEILAVADQKYFVLERGSGVRLYEIDLAGATNIAGVASLASGAFAAVSKRLVADFKALGVDSANYQGMTWGPSLPDGERTLVFVSDNDFNTRTVSKVLALGVS